MMTSVITHIACQGFEASNHPQSGVWLSQTVTERYWRRGQVQKPKDWGGLIADGATSEALQFSVQGQLR